jgi:hypothetical protein
LNGEDQFLVPGDVQPKNCNMGEKVDAFIRDGVYSPKSLTLVITNPRVQAANNVHDAARRVQNNHQNACVVVKVAKDITIYYPRQLKRGQERHTIKTIGEVLDQVDTEIGLDTPVVVMGYSQMMRGESFRTTRRVPTHIVCALGTAMSIEKMIQALGRATYTNSTLEENGFNHVTVLTYPNDYDTACAYPIWLDEMQKKLQHGTSIEDALSPGQRYSGEANFLNKSRRTIGQKTDELHLPVIFDFLKDPDRRLGHKFLIKTAREDPVNALLIDVAKEHFRETYETFREEVKEDGEEVGGTCQDYLDALDEFEDISDKQVSAGLKQLFELGILKKFQQKHQRPRYYLPPESSEGL